MHDAEYSKVLEYSYTDIEEYAKKYIQYYHPEDIPDTLRKLLKNDVSIILDAGCGDGDLLYALKENHLLKSKKVIAVDLSPSRVKISQSIDPKFIVRVDNVETLKTVKSNSIDLVISTAVIEHVDDKKMLKAMWRVIRPGGLAYINTVFKKKYAWYFYRNLEGDWVLDPTHLREYVYDSQLLDSVRKTGFSIKSSDKTLFFWPVIHPLIRVLNIKNRHVFKNRIVNLLGKIKIPIPGYYSWDIILKKTE